MCRSSSSKVALIEVVAVAILLLGFGKSSGGVKDHSNKSSSSSISSCHRAMVLV